MSPRPVEITVVVLGGPWLKVHCGVLSACSWDAYGSPSGLPVVVHKDVPHTPMMGGRIVREFSRGTFVIIKQ